MIRFATLAAVFALAFAVTWSGAPSSVKAQDAPAAAPGVGAKVVDTKGKAVGTVERVIGGADGKPLQVLVRVDRILRTLPTDALTPSGQVFVSVLSRAEIAALPPSE